MSAPDLSGHPALTAPETRAVFAALADNGATTRLVGGTVRNALLGEPVKDIDMATVLSPDEVIARAEAAGLKAIPTGIEHGTVTLVAHGRPVEVTTLRADVETDGRRAVIRYTEDWAEDAERRDFTMNALYSDADGTIFDPLSGVDDILARRVRFIGNAEDRIREDYLRILRFFRFFAYYGHGRPDADGLKACVRMKSGMALLSAERIWSELKRILQAPRPERALLWMRTTEILQTVLPECWGIDAIHALVAAEGIEGWLPDPMLRLAAIIPPRPERIDALSDRLRLSRAETRWLTEWAAADPISNPLEDGPLAMRLYREGWSPVLAHLRLALAKAHGEGKDDIAGELRRNIAFASGWEKPELPVTGKDLQALGREQGPALGDLLAGLEETWIRSGFALSRDELLDEARRRMDSNG